MPSWLILVIIGVVLLVLGFGGVGQFLIWIGLAVLVVSLVLARAGRGGGGRRAWGGLASGGQDVSRA